MLTFFVHISLFFVNIETLACWIHGAEHLYWVSLNHSVRRVLISLNVLVVVEPIVFWETKLIILLKFDTIGRFIRLAFLDLVCDIVERLSSLLLLCDVKLLACELLFPLFASLVLFLFLCLVFTIIDHLLRVQGVTFFIIVVVFLLNVVDKFNAFLSSLFI